MRIIAWGQCATTLALYSHMHTIEVEEKSIAWGSHDCHCKTMCFWYFYLFFSCDFLFLKVNRRAHKWKLIGKTPQKEIQATSWCQMRREGGQQAKKRSCCGQRVSSNDSLLHGLCKAKHLQFKTSTECRLTKHKVYSFYRHWIGTFGSIFKNFTHLFFFFFYCRSNSPKNQFSMAIYFFHFYLLHRHFFSCLVHRK